MVILAALLQVEEPSVPFEYEAELDVSEEIKIYFFCRDPNPHSRLLV
jgi:hypothetical protein